MSAQALISSSKEPSISQSYPLEDLPQSQTQTPTAINSDPNPDNNDNETFSPSLRNRHHYRNKATTPLPKSLLHNLGLRSVTSHQAYRNPRHQHRKEKPKPVLEESRRIALTRLAVHVPPAAISILLIGLNATTFVNGPDVSALANYALQVAAKVHELAIVASLTTVVIDALRYQLLRDGIPFGLLSSPFAFPSLNFLWSQEFLSAIRHPIPLLPKALFILLLAICCLLATVVGPASAVLFIPSQSWLSTGSTEFYMLGAQNDLFPAHLTANHTGPDFCAQGESHLCLHGGWTLLRGFVNPEGNSRRTITIRDGSTQRQMWVWRPYNEHGAGTDTWASTPHSTIAFFARDMQDHHNTAWKYAKGKQRRLRDLIPGRYVRVRGPIPAAHVVCAPFQDVVPERREVAFPIVNGSTDWRIEATPGPVKNVSVNSLLGNKVNATWHSLSPDFGNVTGGLAFVTTNKNGSRSLGSGCSIDARWAYGETFTHGESTTGWRAQIGHHELPETLQYPEPIQRQFFHPIFKDSLGQTITADEEWLQALTHPIFQDETQYNVSTELNMTMLEALLVNTRLWDVGWVAENADAVQELEALVAAYVVNALSRIGWAPQWKPNSWSVNPVLRVGDDKNDRLIHQGGQIYERPVGVETSALEQEWFSYGTSWRLTDSAYTLSVATLALHLLIVFIHSVVIMWKKQTSEAWDSITELVALAYNSAPLSSALQRCGVGIKLMSTLDLRVKIIATEANQENNEEKVQMVLLEDDEGGRKTDYGTNIEVGQKYS